MAGSRKVIKKILISLLFIFILMNVVAYFHASKFTNFDSTGKIKTKNAKQLSFAEKIKTLFLGINNPRPTNKKNPNYPYEVVKLKSNKEIECWHIKTDLSNGTVIIFHGYSGVKSTMLDKADEFINLGYSVLLVDFMGAGGSEGNQCTIGFYEAEEVKTAFNYIKEQGESNIILFGTSMGAAAIMKAQSDFHLKVSSMIIECPFGTMLKTVEARFTTMNVPSFPMANLLVFWGGFQNDFNAFNHNPINYAANIYCPTLLLYGEKDQEVSKQEIDSIFKNLKGSKELKTFPLAAHENYLKKYKSEWIVYTSFFLERNSLNVRN
jgi:alpha-beta hydrolase superfamily lysophospholipase